MSGEEKVMRRRSRTEVLNVCPDVDRNHELESQISSSNPLSLNVTSVLFGGFFHVGAR